MCGKCCCKGKVGAGEEEVLYVPRDKRKCTDCLFCILFVVFWLGMVIIAAVALPGGDPKRLLYGVNHEGEVCGGDKYPNKKRVYYPRITEDILNFAKSGETNPLKMKLFGLCMETCPPMGSVTCTAAGKVALQVLRNATGDPNKSDLALLLMTSVSSNYITYGSKLSNVKKNCWIVPLQTKEYFFRCLWQRNKTSVTYAWCEEPELLRGFPLTDSTPQNITEACVTKREKTESESVSAGQENPLLDQMFDAAEQMGRYVSDCQKAVLPILICGGIFGLIMGFVWLLILQVFAGCMVWLTIWLVVIIMIIATFYAYFKAGILTQEHINVVTDTEAPSELDAADENLQARWKYFAWLLTAVTIILLVLIVALRTKIRNAIAMIKEAARSVKSMPLLMTFPFCSVLFTFILMAYWVVIAGYIYSNGDIKVSDVKLTAAEVASSTGGVQSLLCPRLPDGSYNTTACVGMDAAASFDNKNINNYLLLYHFFGLLWTTNFITGFFTMAIAGAVIIRYFSTNKSAKKKWPVTESIKTVVLKHLGSVAFGSLIIAIVQLIRAILAYLDRKSKKAQEANVLLKYLFKCLACCLWCFEKCIKYIANSAYIMVAMKGKSFCPAAFEAVMLLLKNISQVGVLNVISAFLFVLGKLMVVGACGTLVFLWISNDATYTDADSEDQLYSFWAPTLLTIILAYAVAAAFMNVLGLAIDTILLCYCVDVGRKDAGTAAKPYYASKSMLKAVGKGNSQSYEDAPAKSPSNAGAAAAGAGPKML